MKKTILIALSFILVGSFGYAAKTPRAIKDVFKEVRYNKKVVVMGEVTKVQNFDFFTLQDETGEIPVNRKGIRGEIKKGDSIVVMGIYDDDDDQWGMGDQIYALKWVSIENKKGVQKIVQKYGHDALAEIAQEKEENVTEMTNDIESRLIRLDRLKKKKLITADEYQKQRQRILNDL